MNVEIIVNVRSVDVSMSVMPFGCRLQVVDFGDHRPYDTWKTFIPEKTEVAVWTDDSRGK